MTSLFKRSILLPFGSRTSHLSLCTVTTARSMASNTAKQVHRITMFKVPNSNDIQSILDKYATMAQDAKKDGKPYILRCVAGPAVADARSQGYSLAAQTTFASIEDMKYYDEECEAHAALKAVAKDKVEPPPLMVCFDNAVGDV